MDQLEAYGHGEPDFDGFVILQRGTETLRIVEEVCDFVAYFVAHFAKYAHALFFCALGIGGVFKGPMARVFGSREDRTIFLGVVANGDDEVKISIEILIDAVGCVVGYVDADFTHGANGEWVDCCRADARAMGFIGAIAQMAK